MWILAVCVVVVVTLGVLEWRSWKKAGGDWSSAPRDYSVYSGFPNDGEPRGGPGVG